MTWHLVQVQLTFVQVQGKLVKKLDNIRQHRKFSTALMNNTCNVYPARGVLLTCVLRRRKPGVSARGAQHDPVTQ